MQAVSQPPPAVSITELPKGKQTTPGLYVTAAQAYEMWKFAHCLVARHRPKHQGGTTMRSLILASALMTSSMVFAADTSSTFEMRDASDLVRLCSLPQEDELYRNAIGFCHGVLTGAFRYYLATVTDENQFVCAPNPPTTRAKVMDGFVVWANSHPQYMKEPPVDTLFRYLEETFPCRK
jgi:Rap1a immunity proteins